MVTRKLLPVLLATTMFVTAVMPGNAIAIPVPSSMGTATESARSADIKLIEASFSEPGVQSALTKAGTSADEIRLILPRMTDHDVHMLAQKMDDVKTGGLGLESLLVIILLVILILYLAKRL